MNRVIWKKRRNKMTVLLQSASVTVHPLSVMAFDPSLQSVPSAKISYQFVFLSFLAHGFTMSGLFIFREASSSLIPQTQTKKNKGEGQREGREGDQGAMEGGVGVGFAEFGLCLVWK